MTRDAEHTQTGYEDAASVVVNQAPAPSSLAGGSGLAEFEADKTGVQSRYVIVHQLRASADIQDVATKRETGWATTSDRAELMRRAADAIERLAALSPEAPARDGDEPSYGWLFESDDGTEWSQSHPIESGESQYATNIRAATGPLLVEQMRSAWEVASEALTPRHEAPADHHERNLTASNAELLEQALSHPPLEAPAEGAGDFIGAGDTGKAAIIYGPLSKDYLISLLADRDLEIRSLRARSSAPEAREVKS